MSKKKVFAILLPVLLAIYLIACFFGPVSYKYKNEVKIDGPYKMAYLVINDIKDWPKWYSWSKDDSSFKFSKGGREHYVGANFSFESKRLGNGFAEITESFQDSLITARLKTDKLPGDLNLNWQILPEGTKAFFLKMNARISGRIPFFKRAFYYGLDNKLNNLMDRDLEGIKGYIEELIKTNFGIKKEAFSERYYFGVVDVVVNNKIPQFYAKQLPRVYQFLDSMGISPSGPPAGLIFDWQAINGQVFLMAALPVDKPMKNYAGWTSFTIKPTNCFKLEHYGPYGTLRNAHTQLSYLMDNSDFILAAPVIEEYVTSPSQEPDTSKWLTNVYYLFDNTGGFSKTVQRKWTLEDVVKMEEEQRKEELKKLIQ